jgi:hypothetical protein
VLPLAECLEAVASWHSLVVQDLGLVHRAYEVEGSIPSGRAGSLREYDSWPRSQE